MQTGQGFREHSEETKHGICCSGIDVRYLSWFMCQMPCLPLFREHKIGCAIGLPSPSRTVEAVVSRSNTISAVSISQARRRPYLWCSLGCCSLNRSGLIKLRLNTAQHRLLKQRKHAARAAWLYPTRNAGDTYRLLRIQTSTTVRPDH